MGVNQSAKSKHHIKDDEEVNFDHFQILRAIGKGSFGKSFDGRERLYALGDGDGSQVLWIVCTCFPHPHFLLTDYRYRYQVCIVQKKDTGQMYAMKYMCKAVCLERDALRNVLREIEILVQLDHPFLVNLWFSFHDEEDMFLVQDLLLGGDLRYHLTQNVQFPLEAVKLYIAEIALALDYLQAKHIIHRDVKPDNILLDEEGHAHLTDFNVATLMEESQLATSLSGTKPYMAPEVYACSADEIPGYDNAVDWWSLGVVAFELSTGRRPYDIHSQTPNKDIRLLFHKCPDWPPSWPESFLALVKMMLDPNPSSRLRTVDNLKTLPIMNNIDWDAVLDKAVPPLFTPPKGHLNCDPTFELEEMIVESKPLHKKKKRLAKQRSLREFQSPSAELQEFTLDPLAEEFTTFNRQKELDRVERERKEQEWEEELLRAMEASGSPSSSSTREFRLSDSQLPSDYSIETSTEKNSSPSSASNAPSTSRIPGLNGSLAREARTRGAHSKHSPDTKKSAWSKNRSATMPEGAKAWTKSHKP